MRKIVLIYLSLCLFDNSLCKTQPKSLEFDNRGVFVSNSTFYKGSYYAICSDSSKHNGSLLKISENLNIEDTITLYTSKDGISSATNRIYVDKEIIIYFNNVSHLKFYNGQELQFPTPTKIPDLIISLNKKGKLNWSEFIVGLKSKFSKTRNEIITSGKKGQTILIFNAEGSLLISNDTINSESFLLRQTHLVSFTKNGNINYTHDLPSTYFTPHRLIALKDEFLAILASEESRKHVLGLKRRENPLEVIEDDWALKVFSDRKKFYYLTRENLICANHKVKLWRVKIPKQKLKQGLILRNPTMMMDSRCVYVYTIQSARGKKKISGFDVACEEHLFLEKSTFLKSNGKRINHSETEIDGKWLNYKIINSSSESTTLWMDGQIKKFEDNKHFHEYSNRDI